MAPPPAPVQSPQPEPGPPVPQFGNRKRNAGDDGTVEDYGAADISSQLQYDFAAHIFGAVFFLAFLGWCLSVVARSSYVTNVGIVRDQPIPSATSTTSPVLGSTADIATRR